ncbi:uncharacterized protein LOC113279510 [Papaver somniferum]|uniref:uncharacterized protein LOC113279510 n=1 Tax=Papaver somniferum TaxID=3469 RepID=UPI000E6F4C22|nr:uncharacterized protein LOC113279510 [Papaver somniferum]
MARSLRNAIIPEPITICDLRGVKRNEDGLCINSGGKQSTVVTRINKNKDEQWEVVAIPNRPHGPFIGRSGGLWLLWQEEIEAEVISFSKNLIHLQVKQHGPYPMWNLFCVYGPPKRTDRANFWQILSTYSQYVEEPKCFIGDFNALSSVREKFGGDQSLNNTITHFNNFIRDNHLLDLGFSGPAYTWNNGRQFHSLIRQRLDRVLASPDWCLTFETSGVLHLPRLSSDHSPIILNTCRNTPRNPPSYKFEAYWCAHPDFLKVVLESWNINLTVDLIGKLACLGGFLKSWSKNNIGCIKNKIRNLKKKLLHLQSLNPSTTTLQQEKIVADKLNEYIIMEDTYWEQRMKITWLKTRDRNTKQFHLSVQQRRKKNNISCLQGNNGQWLTKPIEIADELISFFKTLFQQDMGIQAPTNLQDSYFSLETYENTSLSSIPTSEVVWNVVKSMNSFGSPGTDGFPAIFYKKSWSIVGEYTIKFIQQIFRMGELPIVRLSPYLNKFISWSQNALVKNRQVTNNIVIAKELFHSMHKSKSKQGIFALKLDMSKAYDRVYWSFLSFMLHQMGIHDHAHMLIMNCVSTLNFSILFNGSPYGNFASGRGLRQGWPLSPSLFIIFSQGLSLLMAKFENTSLYSGYKINNYAPSISHLIFANDFFFFGRNSESNVNQLKCILDLYSSFSGQIINFFKSSIHFSNGCSPYNKWRTVQILSVREMETNEKYLGTYPLKSDCSIDTFEPLVSKFGNKLSSYRSFYVNSAGRIVLSKNVLAAIPNYSMGISKLLKGVTNQISRIQRAFWWGHETSTRKCHFISWDKVEKAKENGGLGLRNMQQVNISLVSNLVWRFLTCIYASWVQLYKSKYLQSLSFWDCDPKPGGSKTWRDMLSVRNLFTNNCVWFIGSGCNIHIWNDPWIPNVPGFRPTKLPDSRVQVETVSDLFIQGQNQWNIELLLQVFPQDQVEEITNIYIPRDDQVMDKLVWLKTPSGNFTSKSCYKLQADNVATTSSMSAFPWKLLWKQMKTQHKIHIFLWKAVFLGSPLFIDIPEEIEAMQIIQHRLQYADHGIMLSLGSCFLWNICKIRNDVIFNNVTPSVSQCISKALQDFKVFDIRNSLNFCTEVPINQVNVASWQFPPPLYIKINVDVAYNNGKGAVAAVARDSYGNHLGSGTLCFDSFSSTVAEAKAYGFGLQLARRLQVSKIILEGDAEVIRKAIIWNMNEIPWSMCSTILSIQDHIKDFSEVSFTVVPRDANSIAHDLLQFAISNFINRWWIHDEPPNCIMQHLIIED